jgi:hypothetical protein
MSFHAYWSRTSRTAGVGKSSHVDRATFTEAAVGPNAMAGLERLKLATWKFEGFMPRIEPIQNLRCTLSDKLTTHICPLLVCSKPLDQCGLHFRVPDCPLALGIEVGLIVRLGKNLNRPFQCGRDGSLANFDTVVVFEPFDQVFLWKLRIVSFVLAESYADLVRHSDIKSSFLWHCSAPTFGERVWTRLTSWLPTAPFIEWRRVFWEYPECSFPQPHFLPRFLPLMSYDLLLAFLILHQAPQGSVTFPNDPWPSTNLHDLPCCSGRFQNDFCYPPYNLCKLISSIN